MIARPPILTPTSLPSKKGEAHSKSSIKKKKGGYENLSNDCDVIITEEASNFTVIRQLADLIGGLLSKKS